MLVLTRRINGSISICDDKKNVLCEVTVCKIVERDGQTAVQLGFTAPDEIKIYRNELLKKEKDNDNPRKSGSDQGSGKRKAPDAAGERGGRAAAGQHVPCSNPGDDDHADAGQQGSGA